MNPKPNNTKHFKAYEKMPTSLKKLNLEENQIHSLTKEDWVVTEKVHGANFSFIYENKELAFAKRKAILEYPHAKVEACPNVQAIQTGIYYAPSIEYCAFDICIEIDEENRFYLDYEKAIDYFENHDLFYAKALWIGKLNKALEFDINFNSSLPALLGWPELDDNLVEGIVIKPIKNLEYYKNSNLEEEQNYIDYFRPIIKIKNEKFSEEKKFHQAQKWSFIPDTTTKSETLNFLLADMRNYVTLNRLNNVLSKIGKLDLENKERMNEIRNSYIEEVFQDFDENNEQILEMLDKTQQLWLHKRLEAEVIALIKQLEK